MDRKVAEAKQDCVTLTPCRSEERTLTYMLDLLAQARPDQHELIARARRLSDAQLSEEQFTDEADIAFLMFDDDVRDENWDEAVSNLEKFLNELA